MSPAEDAVLTGIAAAPGTAVGRVCFWNDPESVPRYALRPEDVKGELARLDDALAVSRRQLQDLKRRVERELGQDEAAIFSTHSMLLDDPSFYARVEKRLIRENLNLEAVVEEVIEETMRVFRKIPDAYLRERADDYRDVGRRVLENLMSYQRQCTMEGGEPIVLVARDLMPSDTMHFSRQHIGAFVTERGGVSSHAAILARSLGLPAVVSVAGALSRLKAGQRVLVDGALGQIVLDPAVEAVDRAGREREAAEQARHEIRPGLIGRTRDGVAITLQANLTREDEAEDAKRMGAQGVGLLRTEFLFMDRGEFLDEESQYQAYRHVLETLAPHPVTIRTLDLGEDKQFDFENPVEPGNCVLGWRSLRLSLANQEIFSAQLRAILRAGAHGTVRILLPMVTGVEDMTAVRELLETVHRALTAAGVAHAYPVPVGAMIETPAAAVRPEPILAQADFLSVGTNDLVQYVMVADRTNNRLQGYYRPASPAVLFLLQGLARAAAAANRDISICGEIAGDPKYLPLLLGLGYRQLSVAPVLLPDLDRAIGRVDLAAVADLAGRCLAQPTAADIDRVLAEALTANIS